MSVNPRDLVDEHAALVEQVRELIPDAEAIARELAECFRRGGRVYTFGNGGSAADAQHFAAEFLGHLRRQRDPLPATALSTDTSTLTAVANDYAYADVFARQLRALARKGDVAVGITTSGKSENVVRAIRAANERGACTVLLTGGEGGPAANEANFALCVPSRSTARVQEMHILLIHVICELVDDALGVA